MLERFGLSRVLKKRPELPPKVRKWRKEWRAQGINPEGISALTECAPRIDRQAKLFHTPLFGLRRRYTRELVDYLGENPVADLFRSLPEEDPQRELLVRAVTNLINPDIKEDKMEEALEVTRRALAGAPVME